jgi:hypothetical protein
LRDIECNCFEKVLCHPVHEAMLREKTGKEEKEAVIVISLGNVYAYFTIISK